MTSFSQTNYFAILAMVLIALPIATFAFGFDDIAPSLAQTICKEVECGKGRCKAEASLGLGFTCECDAGWRRSRDMDHEDDLKFLPCVIPNCTLNYGSCQPAPPPIPDKEVPRNISAFDPCFWAYCGEGNCMKNNTHHFHTHTCECKAGFFNLLNVTAFPCYSDCTLGSDCSRLGIKVANSNSANGSGSSLDNNHGTSSFPGKLKSVAILMVSVGLAIF